MSSKTAVTVPAGWYADPVEVAASGMATQRRWWDGTHWTHHVAALPTPVSPDVSSATVAAVTAATTAAVGSSRTASGAPIASSATVGLAPATVSPSDSARAAESMPLHSVTRHPARAGASSTTASTAKPTAHPSPAETVTYEPFHARNRLSAPVAHLGSRSPRNPQHLRVHTVSVWLIAAMPITQALLVFWVFSTLPAEGLDWTRALALAFPLVLTAALAGQDTRLMIAEGHQRTAPWLTALIAPPVYLALRGLRVMRSTGAVPWPLVAWLVAQLAVFGVWFTVDPAAVESLISALR